MADGNGMAESGAGDRGTTRRRLVLKPLGMNDIPPHPDLEGHQSNPPDLSTFLGELFAEAKAEDFSTFQKIGTLNDHISTDIPVRVEKLKNKDEENGDVWFARRSEHEERKPLKFLDFYNYVTSNHEQYEMRYTPNIYEANVLLEWSKETSAVPKVPWMGGFEMRSMLLLPHWFALGRFIFLLLLSLFDRF